MEKHMTVPAGKDQLCQLKAGDYVYLTGTIYTARDAAHKRMNESLDQGEKLPVKLEEQVIYYMGPSPAQEVIDAIIRNESVYFAAVGGAGALLSKCIKRSEVVAYDDLGAEAIRRLEIENFPVIVVIDKDGNNLYETAIEKYRKRIEEN